ncbi:MAG: hypothetical protein FWE21_09610 [Defluviitaleaceae bacterium]|nr:hypothetical protein [Defluviitaleaceae bacterium]
MNQAIQLLAELFFIGCLHMIMNMLIDSDKMPIFSKITTMACYAASLFVLTRFIVNNLLPQMTAIFRSIL